MEHSLNSSMGKAVSATEESGWTAYFEDFSNNMEQPISSCYSLGGSSLVSDAASCAAWKSSHHSLSHAVSFSSPGGSPNLPNKLCFKKTRAKQISEDDPLEDTASSLVNSPKIGELSPTEMITRKIDHDQLDDSMGKGFTSEKYSKLQTDDGRHEINFRGKNIDCTELKKKGLCLVPLSMLVNYFE